METGRWGKSSRGTSLRGSPFSILHLPSSSSPQTAPPGVEPGTFRFRAGCAASCATRQSHQRQWSCPDSNRDLDGASVGSYQLDDSPISFREARCRNRTGDSTMARSRDQPLHQSGVMSKQKTPVPSRAPGLEVLSDSCQPSPARVVLRVVLLIGALRAVTGRVLCGGGSLDELGAVLSHGLTKQYERFRNV